MKNSDKIFAAIAAVLITAVGVAAYIIKPANSNESEIIFNLGSPLDEYTESEESILNAESDKSTVDKNKSKSKNQAENTSYKTNKAKTEKGYSKSRTDRKKRKSNVNSSAQTDNDNTTESEIQLPLELNSASKNEIAEVDGVGEKLAARIVAKREELGKFRNRKQLLEVEGIGKAKLAKIWDSFYIDGEVFDEEDDESDTMLESESEIALPLELNSASETEIAQVDGVGGKLAARIVAKREELGKFRNRKQLLEVEGIGKSKLLKIWDSFYIEGEVFDDETTKESETGIELPLELNSASEAELAQVEGINENLAARIVEKRQELGMFRNRSQLLDVKGIGEAKLVEIWDSLYIEGEIFDEETESYSETENTEETDETDYSEETAEYYEYTEASTENYENFTEDNTEPKIETKIEVETETTYFTVDLNAVTFDELMKIPDMTEKLANSILDLREKLGHFENPYELLYADGMTKKFFSEHEIYFTVTRK